MMRLLMCTAYDRVVVMILLYDLLMTCERCLLSLHSSVSVIEDSLTAL